MSAYLTKSTKRFFARKCSLKRPLQTGQRTSGQLDKLKSALSFPVEFETKRRPQTHFDSKIEVLKRISCQQIPNSLAEV